MISISTKYKWLEPAIDLAHTKMYSEQMGKILKAFKNPDSSDISGEEFWELMHKTRLKLRVSLRCTWPWLPTTAWSAPPTLIQLRNRGLKYRAKNKIWTVCRSISHEAVHLIDYEDKDHRFGHGSNSWKGKENTLPYFFGFHVEKMIEEEMFLMGNIFS